MIKNVRARAAKVAAVGVIAGLAVAATPTAHALPNDRVLLAKGSHVPATQLPRSERASCLPPTANDSVLLTVKHVLDQVGVSSKVRLATFEAGWVESHFNNLDCGDRDSYGVFQQRPSQGWGTVAQIRNIPNATRHFLYGNPSDTTPGVIELAKAHPDWSAGDIAQGVQHSGCPGCYDQNRATAENLIKRATALDVTDLGVSAVVGAHGSKAVFTRNTNGRLSTNVATTTGTWGDWINRDAAILGSGPDATSRVTGTYDVVARRTDGTVIIKSKTSKGWQPWRVLAGGLKTNYAPAIVTYNTKTIYVYAARASDGALMSVRWHDGDGFGTWHKVGTNTGLTSGPDATKINTNTIAVAFRGPTGNIRITHYTTSHGWTGAVNWGTPKAGTKPGTAPAITSRTTNSIDLMVQDKNGTLHRKTDKPTATWTTPDLPKINQGPDLTTTTTNNLQLFARNTNGTPVTATWTAGHGWTTLHKIGK